MKIQHSIGFILMYIVTSVQCSSMDLYKNTHLSPRIVQTRYGRLQGVILPLDSYKFLKPIEAFLGVPYATPPIKSNRTHPRVPMKFPTYIKRNFSEWKSFGEFLGHVCPLSAVARLDLEEMLKEIDIDLMINVGEMSTWKYK
uniref:Carboxylesterase type B domain-containing protein n=1 Tax=Phlebotomus papatasi TaxID=29031 RepID=A0A1B0CYX0_PHLPP